MSLPTSSFYVTGGTLRQGAPSYVERQADRDLYAGLMAGEFCYVLTSRQMGKSSLMVHTAARLREAGIAVAVLDLTAIGQNLSAEQWYGGLLRRLGLQLDATGKLEEELDECWFDQQARMGPLERWMAALQRVVLPRIPGRIVVFIDEIDAVRSLPFSTDEFFAAIRECFNRRTQDAAFERLAFCLLGVASPSDLIQDVRTTPFNIGQRIELSDFSPAEAAPLADGLRPTPPPAPPLQGEGGLSPCPVREGSAGSMAPPSLAGKGAGGLGPAEAILQRILYWTGGHPYLTQRLCQAVAASSITDGAGVDGCCEELFFASRAQERDDNLVFVRERLLKGGGGYLPEGEVLAGLLDLYGQVRRGRGVPDDEMDPFVGVLRLSGIVRAVKGRLEVRNRIYERVFDPEWVTAHMPGAELRRQREAFRRGAWRTAALGAVILAAMGGLALTAAQQARRAERQRQRAVQQQRIAEAARLVAHRELYASEMIQARQAWEAGVVRRAQDLLESFRPTPGEEDLRGLEWRLLWRLCHHEEASVPRPGTGPLTLGLVSPDGRLLAAVDAHNLELWNLVTRRPIATFTGYWDKELVAHFSSDNRMLATSFWLPQKIRGWELRGQRRIVPVQGSIPWGGTNSTSPLKPIAFSPDGRTFAVGTDRTIRLWDLAARRLVADLPRPVTGGLGLAFTAQGRLLAAGSRGNTVEVWDMSRRQRVAAFPGGFYGRFGGVLSPDGRLLATAEPLAGRVRVWDFDTQRLLASFTVPPGNRLARAFSPDSRRLAVGGGDFTLRVWNLTTLAEEATFRGQRFMTAHVAFTPDGRWVVSDNDLRFWPVARPDPDLLHAEGDFPWGLSFSPDGNRLATAGVRGQVNVWDVATRRRLAAWNTGKYTWSVACSPDGRTIAAGSVDDTEHLWDLPTRKLLYTFKKRPRTGNHPMAFSPDGRTLAVSGGEIGDELVLWDVASHREIARFHGHKNDIASIAFFQDGRRVVSGCTDGTTRVWDIPGRRQVDLFPYANSVYQIALSRDNRLLAITGEGDLVDVWDVRAHRKVAALKSYTGEITHLEFSPDGKTLLTSDQSGPLRLWSTQSWRETAAIQEPLRVYNAVALSPDGSTLALGRSDGSIHLLRAANRIETDRPAPIATRNDRQVLLQWPTLPAVLGYHVYRGPENAPASQLRKLTAQPLTTTSYRDASHDVWSDRPLTYAVSALFRDTDGRTIEGPAVRTTAIRSVVPEGWTGSSINEGSNAGSVQAAADRITLRGSGADFWNEADGGHFLNRLVNGDFRITVQLDSGPMATDDWAKAGLMLRESLDPGAREVHLVYTPSRLLECQWRAAAAGATENRVDVPPGRTKRPSLLRLTRHGNRVSGEYSTDGGRSFRPVGEPMLFAPPLSAALRVGLAITAHNPDQVSEARFDGLRVEALRR